MDRFLVLFQGSRGIFLFDRCICDPVVLNVAVSTACDACPSPHIHAFVSDLSSAQVLFRKPTRVPCTRR